MGDLSLSGPRRLETPYPDPFTTDASTRHPSAWYTIMQMIMLLNSTYAFASSLFSTACIGAALVWWVDLSTCHHGLVVLWSSAVERSGDCIVFARMTNVFTRLIYRAYLVLHKPLDELVSLLGFEIPLGPHLDLAAVKADGAFLHWKPASDRRSSHKYEVQVNGSVGKSQQWEGYSGEC